MDLRRISYFVEVAECKSFTRAGGRLAIAQSALSRQIRDLEDELGISLLHRTGRGVELTDAGKLFLERARKLLGDAEALFADAKAMNNGGGTVSLGVPPSISQILLAPFLSRMRREKPDIRIRVVEGFSGHVSEWLLNGRIDLAVLYNSPSTASLLTDHLLIEDMYLVGPAGERAFTEPTIALASVSVLPLVLPGRPHGLRVLIEKASSKAGIELKIDIEVDALATMKMLAADGTAYTILPVSAVFEELQQHRLGAAKIVEPGISRELVLASSTQRPTTRASQDVARILRRQVCDLVANGQWLGRQLSA